jgi:uncharacterized protein CbrC (UPF0167 family)
MAGAFAAFAPQAFAQDGVFENYAALKATMDEHVVTRQMDKLMIAFGGADEMTKEQLNDLTARVRQVYPSDLVNNTLVRKREMENGWRQELWSYWEGTRYLFVYVLIHEREDATVSVNFLFNSNFDKAHEDF